MTMQTGLTFGMSLEQTEKFRAWRDDPKIHEKCQKVERRTAIGGAITFSFTPNSLGMGIDASCCVCKNKIDLTDYDSW
jgi:hypothetical protein